MRPWKVAVIVGVLAAVGLLAAVAIASGADRQLVGGDRAACDGSGAAARTQDAGTRGFGASGEMRAWREQYADDPYSAEAQAALDALRAQHQAENQAGDPEACVGDGDAGGGYGRGGGSGYGHGGGMMGGGDEW
jgi:hypothetical protein